MSASAEAEARAVGAPRGPSKGGLTLVWHELRYDLLAFSRNQRARFFTVALPVLFLVIFASVFGDGTINQNGQQIKLTTYYVPRLIALGIISGSFINTVMSVVTMRENGILKRRRSAPVPAWVLIAGGAMTSIVVSFLIVILLTLVGVVAYGVHVPSATLPGLILAVVVGTICFCLIGYAVASLVDTEDAAQPLTQLIMLPLYFISGVFVPNSQIPNWLQNISEVFPVRALAQALGTGYLPGGQAPGISWDNIAVMAAWAVGALVIALWRFSWMPRGE